MPDWLVKISKEKSVRRMMFIRQLGLKAYIDYPGAIHTRYSHVLGVMNLAGKVIDMLADLEKKKGRPETANSLQNNKNNVMAAGFFHDIGHGPYSHVVDYILKKYAKKSHENIAYEIIKRFEEIENHGITINKVKEIINGTHPYPFLSQVVNGPIDADKLDYLLRDAHHVGLKYSLDLDHFINNFRILGIDSSQLTRCELGLEDIGEAIVTAEIFLVIWKSMYDLVYHVEDSRIAEKMLEKAIILRIDNDKDFGKHFADIDTFIQLNDERLFEALKDGPGLSKELTEGIEDNKLYTKILDQELSAPAFTMSAKFISELDHSDDLADKMSFKLTEELKFYAKYEIICDIVKSRIPAAIHLRSYDRDSGEPIELKSKSLIVGAIKEKARIKIYVKSTLSKKIDENFISKPLRDIVAGW
jgi:HD superfamily phosphohydrolase